MNWLLVVSLLAHLVATIVWLGGLLLGTLLLWPELRRLAARNPQGAVLFDLLDRLRKRFYPLANVSLVMLIGTGLYQMSANPNYQGLFVFANDWSRAILLKHVAVLGMILVGAAMQWSVLPALERAILLASKGRSPQEVDRLRRRERQLTALNAVLGGVVLICTAVATAV